MGIDETGADAVGDEIRMRQHRRQERNVGGDAADAELAQRPRGLLHHVGPVRAGECTMTLASSESKAALVL